MSEIAPQASAGIVDWGDTSFQPDQRQNYGDDPIRFFRMGHALPTNPIQGRKFQLAGKERVALLEEQVFHCWSHRFSITYMGSGVNGTRRCVLDSLGECLACQHFDAAPTVVEDGKNVKKARCGKRQQQFGTNLLVYKTDIEGHLVDAGGNFITLDPERGPILQSGAPAELVYDVYLWRFSADKFQSIREIKQEWQTLKNNDLSFMLAPGKPENFQDFSPTVLPGSAWRLLGKVNPEAAKNLIKYYQDNRYDVEAILGKQYTNDDMKRFLGLSDAGGSRPSAAATGDIAAEIERELAAIGVSVPAVPEQTAPPAQQPQPAPALAAAPAAPASAPEPPAAPAAPPAPPTDTTDFDALLSSNN